MNSKILKTGLIFVWGLCFFCSLTVVWAAEVAKVALLPLTINAPDRLDYLRQGLQDIMASRVSWEGKVLVLDKALVEKALIKVSGPIDENRALDLGKNLGADYVIFGSLTMAGVGASIDLRVVDLSKKQPVEKFFTQTKGVDEIIPRMNDLIADLNEKIFGRPQLQAAAPQLSPELQAAVGGSSGEKTPIALKDFTLKPLSPQIIMNAGGFDLAGIWRSTILPYALRDLAFGDLDGDGNLETVVISQNAVYIYRFKDEKFELLKEIKGGRYDNYVGVDVADINGTGRPQIFVSNFRDDGDRSLVVAWDQGNYSVIAEKIPYLIRVQQLPGRGQVLLGQQRQGDWALGGDIKVLSWKDKRYTPTETLKLPEGINIFNFIMADLNGDGSFNTIFLNEKNKLVILSDKGKVEYTSAAHYGGTVNMINAKQWTAADAISGTIMSDRVGRTYLPARLVVIPGSKPGHLEVIVNKNKDSLWNILDRFESFTSGVIYSLSWDGVDIKENWRTMTIMDYVANYGVGDFRNNRQKQLVVGVVQSRGFPFLASARSLLYCYDLGVFRADRK
jgi:hypothetical protein